LVSIDILISVILFWGLVASLIFTFIIFGMYSLDIGNLVRDQNGNFKKREKMSVKGYLLFISMIILFIGYPILVNILLLQGGIQLVTVEFFLLSYGVFFVANFWDLVIIDYFLVVKNILRLKRIPETSYYTTFRPHIIGFFRGLIFGLIFSFVSTVIFLIVGS
jgi:hypothetical protein